ncbi:MAG TPA: LysR family transcriptional regulator [Candidatus Binatia bacterium]|jgi:DNA-binding transcriptional LysR family regulator
MTLHQLKVFVKVAELQSFTQAAKALRLTQPSVSALVQDLVSELRYKLFERRGAKVFLTQEGNVLLRRTQEALAIIEDTKDEIEEIHGLKKGRLSIGGCAIAGASFLPGAVQSFKQAHLGVDVNFNIYRSSALERMLLDGQFDIALLGCVPHSPALRGTLYAEEDIMVVAPANHPLNIQRSVSLKRLAKEPLITQQKGSLVRDMVEEKFVAKRLPFKPLLEIDVERGGWEAIKASVVSGLGIGFLCRPHIESDATAGRLKLLRVPELGLKRPVYIVYRKNHQRSALVQAFVDFLKSYKGQ